MKLLNRRPRKLLLFIGVFMLNVAFGGLTVGLFTEPGATKTKNQRHMPFDEADVHYRMHAPAVRDSPARLRETGPGFHFTVLK